MPPSASYNERSWAIDLIGHLKKLAGRVNRPVKDAGGENTVRSEGGILFPDVLLYGDRDIENILQYTLEVWGEEQEAVYWSVLWDAFTRI